MTDFANAFVLLANFVLIPAVTYGAQLALGALGVTLVHGVLRFSNFAHGDTMAFGAMFTILATQALQTAGIGIAPLPTALLALPVGIASTIIFVIAADKSVYAYYRRKKSPPIIFLMASIGIMFVLNGIVRLVIGVDDVRFDDGERFIITVSTFKELSGLQEGLAIRTSQALTVFTAALLAATLFWFLRATKTGKAMRAFSDNEKLALLSGISPNRIIIITWIMTGILAAVAGTLYGLDKSFKPFIYFQLLLPVFAAAIVGGLGNPAGAIAGGFVIAFSEVGLTYVYKKFLTYLLPTDWAPAGLVQLLSTEYKFAVSFVILVLTLLIRPTGIFRGSAP
jgi:branched-chain amino acid transport system permease protein